MSEPREFVDVDLSGARFDRVDLTGAVMRGVHVHGLEIEAPWLVEGGDLRVNGVDVVGYVDAELDRRFPGRSLRTAADPAGLQEAWSAVEQTWAATLERARALPPAALEESVAGEWSFVQTQRHLVMATDVWLTSAILGTGEPFHPLGLPHAEYAADGYDASVFATTDPTLEELLPVRAGRQAMVREFLADVTPEQLAEPRRSPWAPPDTDELHETVLSCLHTILEEEWEHHRYAVRDLELVNAR